MEVANGFKMGTVKFIGDTEFAPGEWIGVALERPQGEGGREGGREEGGRGER